MKNSTFSAQVANNLLKVLQGYTKGIRFIALLTILCTIGVGNAWAESLQATLDFTTNSWELPTSKVVDEQSFTSGAYTIKVKGTSGNGYNFNSSNKYLLMGKSGATLTLPAFDFTTTKIVITGKSGASGSVQQNIYVGSTAVSTATTGATGTNTYIINSSYQAAGNVYVLKVTSAHNTQITKIEIYGEAGGSTPPTPSTTYTINWHTAVGTVEDEVLEEGATITKPATDPTMSGYVFMGWTEACEVASNGSDFTAITNFGTATEDKDYYAVFAEATTTGGGGGSTTGSKTLVSSSSSSHYQSGYITGVSGTNSASWTADGFTMVQNKNSSSSAVALNFAEIRVYASHSIVFTPTSGSTITSIVATATTNAYANALGGSSIANCTKEVSGSTVTITPTDGTSAVTLTNTAQSRLSKIVVNYTTSGGGGSTTYDNYITTCSGSTPEPDPIPVTGVTLNKTSHEMQEGETVTLTATVTPDNADDKTVSWESSDDAVAKVNTNGIVTAVSPGNATITVTTTDGGHTATCTITVNALPTVEGTWTLVTDAANLKAGDRIVIAAAESDFALSTTQNNNNRGQAAVTKNGNNITFTEATQIITLVATDNANVPFAFSTGDAGYLYAASSSGNQLKTKATLDDHGKWAITINADTASIIASTSTNRNVMQYNKTNGLFACYASASQEPIAIYKEGGGTLTYTITSTLSHVTANGGNPTTITSEAEDLTLTYSAESGWNLPATISVTMGGTPLSSETDYDWDNGYLFIAPASGFTGNIVVTINGWQQLAAPENPKTTNITATSATLSWNEVANASSYLVTIVDGGDLSADIPNTQTSHTFEGLTPSTEYLWTVKAIGDGITYTNSEESETAEFTTPAAATPTAGYTIIHHRQALDGNYIADSLVVKTTGTADVGSIITAEKKTYTGFVCNDAVQTITIQADAAQNVVTYNYVRQSYTLTWDLDGGNIIAEGTPAGTVKYGAPLTAPTVEKAGYRFDHWNPNVPATMQDGNRTYKAFYTQQHTVKWVSQGTVIRTDTYDTGAALEAAPTTGIVECDGKNHVGWTAQGGYAHSTAAPADLFTESSGTVTADATYYAVYAEGSGGGGTGWTAVTSTSDLEAGATYAISNAANGGTYLSTWDGGNNFDGSTTIICPLILGGSEGAWTFQISDGSTHNDKYLTATSAASNRLKAVNPVDDYSYFTISFDIDNGNAVITCTGKNTNNILRKNNQSDLFACYSSGQDDVYLQKLTGGGGYTNYTTSCASITSIRIEGQTTTFDQYDAFNFGGKVYAIDEEDNETDVTELADFTGYNMSQLGTQTVTVRYSGCSVTYEITVNKPPVWNITWSVGGQTNTGIGPREVVQGKTIGECSNTGDLQIPAVPTGCTGKTFIGWTESNTVPTDGVGIAYIDKNTQPDSDKTYYAVFATKEVGDGVALTQCNGSTAFNAGDNIVIVASGNDWSYLCYQITSGTTYIAYSDFTNDAATLIEDDKNYWTLETATDGFYLGDNTNGYMYLPDGNDLCVSTENKSTWTIEWNADSCAFNIKSDRWLSCRSDLSEGNKYKWRGGGTDGQSGTTNLQIYKISGSTSYTDYSTSCGTYTVTFYGFNSGGYTTTCNDNPAVDEVEQGGTYVIPNCEPTFDPAELGRTFAGTWNTQANGKGTAYKPGDEIANVSNDITLYAQWALNTSENTTLPTDVDDLATTDIVVNGGHTLTLQAGNTYINSLTLKGGLQDNGSYAMPVVNIPTGATLVRNNNKINLDLKVNNNSYYPFAVPFEVANTSANVNYINTTLKEYANANNGYGKYYRILEYNGAGRADNGVHEDNWVHVGRTDVKLMPGKGYAISAVPAAGDDTVTIRITMTVDNAWLADGEQESITVKEQTTTRNTVDVTAHTGAAAEEHPRHAGWNFVANPYLSNFTGGGIDATNGLDYIDGKLIIQGSYEYSKETVPYVTIPAYNFAHYYQVKLSEAPLSPAYSFFVQVGESGTMTFDVAGRQAAPASIAARNAEERPVKMDVDITLSDNHSSDQTGIIISDRYSDAYEIGRDLEKLFGSAYNLSVYTLMADNTPLAFQALAIRSSMQVIPVGYRTPAQGEYTFRLNEATSSIDLLNEQYEQLVLVDYQTGELTNLLIADYTFYSERTQADNRFAIYAVPRQNAPTDLPNAIGQDKQAQKILHNGHLYILRDGNVYNGNGQIVK